MPRYYFHIVDDHTRTIDDEGMVLAGLTAVADEAEASARDLLAQDLSTHRPSDNNCRIEAVDENGTLVLVQLLRTIKK